MAPRKSNIYKQKVRENKAKIWQPTLMAPKAGQITSTLNRVTQAFLQEIGNTNKDLPEYLKMARKDPLVRSCIELKCLRAAIMLGKYSHHNSQVEEWVQHNLDSMHGSLTHKVGRLAAAMALGFSAAEIVFTDEIKGQWRLKTINILDQTKSTFEGKNGEAVYLRYREPTGLDKRVPYHKIIHVVNGFSTNIGEYDMVYGDPESCTAHQYFKAKQAILTEMMISAKNSASGMWLGQADSNETVQIVDVNGNPRFNSDGTPMTQSAVHALQQQLLNLENNSVIVTDTKNRVQPLIPDGKEATWANYIQILDNGIMRAYGIPEGIFKEGTNTTLSNTLGRQHKTILDAQIESIVSQIRDQLVEKVIKPLLVWNFGITEDFGSFKLDEVQDQESVSLRVQNIISAVSAQILPAQNIHIQNALYDSLGLPTINEREMAGLQQQQLIKTFLENQTQMGLLNPMTGAQAPSVEQPGQDQIQAQEQHDAAQQQAGASEEQNQGGQ